MNRGLGGGIVFSGRDRLRLAEHVFNHLPQLLTVLHFFHQRLRNSAITYNPDCGSMFHSNALPERIIGLYLLRELTIGIFGERYGDLVLVTKSLYPVLQVCLGELLLIGKDVATKLVADLGLPGVFGVEIAGPNCRLKRPVMPG